MLFFQNLQTRCAKSSWFSGKYSKISSRSSAVCRAACVAGVGASCASLSAVLVDTMVVVKLSMLALCRVGS